MKTGTHIRHAELKFTVEGEGEEQTVLIDTVWVEPAHELTATEKQAGTYSIKDLKAGTNYLAYILNGDVLRGKYRFLTLGSSVGETIDVQSEMILSFVCFCPGRTGNSGFQRWRKLYVW